MKPIGITCVLLTLQLLLLAFPSVAFAEPEVPKGSAKPLKISVYTNHRIREIPRELFGTNLEWFHNGNGLWEAPEMRIDPVLSDMMHDQGIPLIRFPGGTLSDFYEWRDGIGPQSQRPPRPHFTDPGSSDNSFGTPELLSLCRKISATPLITVNVGTGTPQMAAEWVDYMNNPANQLRQADGFHPPLPVRLWEIGNELYLNGTEVEAGISMEPERYAARYLEYAAKMKAVDPSIQLIAPARAESYSVPFGPHQDWNRTVLELAGEQIDFLALHNSYFPVMTGKLDNSLEEVYKAMWGAPLDVDEDLHRLEQVIQELKIKRPIGLAITEWGPFFSATDPQLKNQVSTLGSGVFVARIMQVFISRPSVRIANYFKFTDNTFMGWVNEDGLPKIPYSVLQMYSRYFGTHLVRSTVDSPGYASNSTGFTRSRPHIPEINIIAATNTNNTKLYINIVSCSWEKSHRVRLDLQDFQHTGQAIKRTISGPDPFVFNSTAKPVGIETSSLNPTEELVIPPHSITTIELDGQPKIRTADLLTFLGLLSKENGS